MCIAIIKPKNVEVPKKEILFNCFKNNSDGAGFAFNHNGKVIIKKGYMKFEDFYNAFSNYDKKFNFKSKGLLIHFRIATHGSVDQSMTHPFPIQSDDGALKKIEYISDFAVIHNGMISLTSSKATKKSGLSDTAIFIKDYLYNISMNKNWFKCKQNIELIEKLIDSKMAILNSNGDYIKTSGFIEDNGVLYSNTSYQDNYFKLKKYNSYIFDYDDYYYNELYYDDVFDYSKENKHNKDNIKLMKLEEGDIVEYGGYSEIIKKEDEGCGYFVTENGDFYYGLNNNLDGMYDFDKMDFYYISSDIKVYDKNAKEKEFKKTNIAKYSQFPYLE